MMLAKSMIAALAVLLVAATSPTWERWQKTDEPDVYRVLNYLELGAKGTKAVAAEGAEAEPTKAMVVIAGGRAQGVIVGQILRTFRPTRPAEAAKHSPKQAGMTQDGASPLWVETGRLKTVDVQETYTLAMIESQATPMSSAFFPRFPGVMAGDLAVAQRMEIVRKQVMTPTVDLAYRSIFIDPKATPSSFELKNEAVETLREAVRPFKDARLSLLMIEGYTDHNGAASANQIESYQRALTVRQFLIDELGFDEKRVVAVGYGEAEPADASMKPGYETENRRIVLKAIPVPQTR